MVPWGRKMTDRSTLIIVELCVSGPRSAAKRLTHFSQRKLGELQAENSVRLGSVRSFALSLSLSLSLFPRSDVVLSYATTLAASAALSYPN